MVVRKLNVLTYYTSFLIGQIKFFLQNGVTNHEGDIHCRHRVLQVTGHCMVKLVLQENRLMSINAAICGPIVYFTVILAQMGPASFLVLAVYLGCSKDAAIAMFMLCMLTMGPNFGAMKVNPNDVSPNYSGSIMAVMNGIGSIAGMVVPHLISVIAKNATFTEWKIVFWLTFLVFGVTTLFYVIVFDAHEQWWNDPAKVEVAEEERKAAKETRRLAKLERAANR